MKRLFNRVPLVIGLILISYPYLSDKISFLPQLSLKPPQASLDATAWRVKPGSIYDGDTLRLIGNERELKIRLCGIDAPERSQKLGIEARDHLRALVDIGNGELLLLPVEQDRYGRTVAEVYVKDSRSTAINLNVQMVRDGYAWHYAKYSGNCPIRGEFAIAQELAQEEKLGIWNGNPQPPWDYRKANK